MSQAPNTGELKDQCADMQLKLGLNDVQWKALFGNEKGLYGFIHQHDNQLRIKLLEALEAQKVAPDSANPQPLEANQEDKQ